MPLSRLLAALDPAVHLGEAEVEVTGITSDTRELSPGEVYVAIPGDHVDGFHYISQAIQQHASVVVTEAEVGELPVPIVRVPDARKALSRLSAAYWGHPSRELRVVGVTGTDGKTTTTYLASAVLEAAGYRTGFITTVDVKVGERQERSRERVTTPQPPALHRRLREMVDAGVEYAVLESSSHGLALSRLDDAAFDVAVLTNVTSEHLELHGSVERYRLDKAKLFSMLARGPEKGTGKWGVINADDPNADLFERASGGRTMTYGTARWADVVGEQITQERGGISFRVRTPQAEQRMFLPMLGAYNAYNALAAICVGLSQGVSLEQARTTLERFRGVPGRMQRIEEGQPFSVVVDYAHTAAALEKVLRILRQTTPGKLIVVFGSAGERDRAKRPEMGRVAARHADLAILTDEDPRGEDRTAILREIAAGLESEGAREGQEYLLIPDREEAIAEAFGRALPRDAVLLAGKGHEPSIEYADHWIRWDEAAVARELLQISPLRQSDTL